MDGEIKLPIVPELNLEATKKAYNQIENYFIDKVGKKFQIENAKMIDSQKRMYQAFVKVGQKYASIMYQVNRKGELKGIPKIAEYLSGPNKGQLRTLTRKQAMKLNEANTINQYRRILGDITPRKTKKTLKTQIKEDEQKPEITSTKTLKKLSGFTRLLNTFKRVGFYRIARRSFQFIEQGFAKGLQNIAKFSPEVNKSLSSITSQFTILANSVANILVPFLKLIEPILKNITTSIANMSSVISYLIAKLKGSSKYLKVNTEYLSDFNKEVNNFSFDKFEALSSDDTANMFIEEDISKGISSELEKIQNFLIGIASILLGIGALKIMSFLMGNGFRNFIKSFKNFNGSFAVFAEKAIGLAGVIGGAYLTISAIVDIIDWDEQTSGVTKFLTILKLVFGIIAGIAGMIAFIKAGTVAGGIAAAISITALASGIATGIAQKASKNADNTMVNRDSLFVERNADKSLGTVTQTSSGQSGTNNVSGFQQAMLGALHEWSASSGEGENYIVLNIDGAEVARSKRFKDELNRTNTQLNLR